MKSVELSEKILLNGKDENFLHDDGFMVTVENAVLHILQIKVFTKYFQLFSNYTTVHVKSIFVEIKVDQFTHEKMRKCVLETSQAEKEHLNMWR